jgi:dimethylargininase
MGRRLLIGISSRTNAEGARQLTELVGRHGYATTCIPLAAGLHLKSSVNGLAEDTLLVTAEFAGRSELAGFAKIVVPDGEEYAANTLWINGTLLTPEGYPRTRELLLGMGYSLVELATSEMRKLDGGLTCLSLRF